MQKQSLRSAQLISAFVYTTQYNSFTSLIRNIKLLTCFCDCHCTAWFVSDLVRNPEDWFSCIMAHSYLLKFSLSFISLSLSFLLPAFLLLSLTILSTCREIGTNITGIFLPFQNRDPGPMILGKITRKSVKLEKWIQNRTGDNMYIWC